MYWNHGDCYGGNLSAPNQPKLGKRDPYSDFPKVRARNRVPKCLCLQNYRLILKMVDTQNWILRNTIVWHKCLSGSTMMFAYIDKKPIVASLKDILRLNNNHEIELIGSNGNKVRVLKHWRSKQPSIHITFRDGLEVTCSDTHRWVLKEGELKEARKLQKGDVIKKVQHKLPKLKDGIWNYDWGWFIGLYLAEGNKDKEGVRLSLHKKEIRWTEKIDKLFEPFGVKCSPHIYGNNLVVQIHSYLAKGIIDTFVRGRLSYGKRLAREAFMYGQDFIKGIIDGWLDGDGHFEKYNSRWKVGMTRNKGMIDDLRACAMISGYMFRARQGWAKYQNGRKPCVRITVRKSLKSHHYNRKSDTEIMKITRSEKVRNLYDLEVSDNHLFTLLNGALSHNSNAMPSSVKNRFSNAYEPVFMLVKNNKAQYYYNVKTGLMADRKPKEPKENVDWYWKKHEACNGRGCDNKRCVDGQIKESYWRSLVYWFDLDSVRKPHKAQSLERVKGIWNGHREPMSSYQGMDIKKMCHPSGRNPGDVWEVKEDLEKKGYKVGQMPNVDRTWKVKENPKDVSYQWKQDMPRATHPAGKNPGDVWEVKTRTKKAGKEYKSRDLERHINPKGKNPGDLWKIPTQPFKDAHFATFPEKLIIPMIKSSCPMQICKKCGKARVRISKTTYVILRKSKIQDQPKQKASKQPFGFNKGAVAQSKHTTIGWTDCGCRILTCNKCGFVLEYDYETKANNKVQKVRKGLFSEGQMVSQDDLLRKEVQFGVERRTQGKHNLSDKKQEGLHLALEQENPKIRNGTPSNNGKRVGKDIREKRNRPSQKRSKRRQQIGEFDSNEGVLPQQSNTKKIKADADRMSSLRKENDAIKSCPKCKTPLKEEKYPTRAGTCLDPFMGSGTTALVARKHGRSWIGIEISKAYIKIAEKRLQQQHLGL